MKRTTLIALIALAVITFTYFDKLKGMVAKNTASTSNTLIVGTSADNPPYEFLDAQQQVVGIDIDIANEIAKRLNTKLELRNMDFQGLIPSLQAKRLTCVIAGLSNTLERAEHVSFSIPYLTTKMAFLFSKAQPITALEDLNNKRIGVQSGTSWEQQAKHFANTYLGITLKSLTNNLFLVEELKNGKLDVLILEHYQAKKLIDLNPELASMVIPNAQSEFAIAFNKGDPLVEQVNQVITELLNNGTIEALHEIYFPDVDNVEEKAAY